MGSFHCVNKPRRGAIDPFERSSTVILLGYFDIPFKTTSNNSNYTHYSMNGRGRSDRGHGRGRGRSAGRGTNYTGSTQTRVQMRGMGDYYCVAVYVDDLVISTRTTSAVNERTAAQYSAIQQLTTVCPAGHEWLERERSSPTRMLSSTIGGTGMSGRDNGCDRARADYTIAKQE